MDTMEEKMGAILGNPQMMQQIMAMAQSLSAVQETPQQKSGHSDPPDSGGIDPAMLQKILSLAGQMGPDSHQEALVCALRPYLSRSRMEKLEKAMHAAKLANLVTAAFRSGALSFLTGR